VTRRAARYQTVISNQLETEVIKEPHLNQQEPSPQQKKWPARRYKLPTGQANP